MKWDEIVKAIKEQIELRRDALEAAEHAREVDRLQGEISAFRWMLSLPEMTEEVRDRDLAFAPEDDATPLDEGELYGR